MALILEGAKRAILWLLLDKRDERYEVSFQNIPTL